MKLLEKTHIGNVSLKNRFFKAAVWENLADEKGHMTDELFSVYEELAKGGVGAILTGYAFVLENEQPNPGMMGIYDDSFIEEYKNLTQMVHTHDTKIFLQLAYGGSMSGLKPPSESILGASAIMNEQTGITPLEMTKADIKEMTEAFANAAKRAKIAGFDGVEIHAAHGYLLSLFLCPSYNQRTDEYGGTIQNRARFLVEIATAIREIVGNDFLVLAKINSEDFMENGLTSEESIIAVQMLEKVGLDAIEISGGNGSSSFVAKNNLGAVRKKINAENESYFSEHAKKLKKVVDIPVILTGGNRSYERMETLHEESRIDFFALGRPFIREPDLINKWQENKTAQAKCISCNACFSTHGKRCVFNIKKNASK